MGLVVGDLLILTVIVTVGGIVALLISKSKDARLLEHDQIKRQREADRLKREAKLYDEGVPLICVGCEAKFVGPLTLSGCPKCHSTTLIVTEEELISSQENSHGSQAAE